MQSTLFTAVLLPLALALVMLGMGLSLVPEDFRRIARDPRAVAIGSGCQLLLLPLLAWLLASWLPLQPTIAVGLLILACCPGGPSSNLITYLARGDVALSVSLTAVSSVVTVFTIPLFTNLALRHFLGETSTVSLPLGSTIVQILLITLVPILIGMAVRQRFPALARRLERQMSRLALALLALIILLLLVRDATRLPGFLMQVGGAVVLLNLLAMLLGFGISRLFALPRPQQLCNAIEVGIQNGTLAIAISAGLLNNPELAIPAAVYSLWMYVSGFAAVLLGRRLIPAASA